MVTTYRLGRTLSYVTLLAALFVTGCAEERASVPKNLIVAATSPPRWAAASSDVSRTGPQIIAVRLSSLNVPLGADWDGDVVTSTDVATVEIFTNLFDFSLLQSGPGRFHFTMHALDVPAFLVRPYTLHLIARTLDGRETIERIPFRLSGRS